MPAGLLARTGRAPTRADATHELPTTTVPTRERPKIPRTSREARSRST